MKISVMNEIPGEVPYAPWVKKPFSILFALTIGLTLTPMSFASVLPMSDAPTESHLEELNKPLLHNATTPWWEEDVWSDPDRPFLYYGIEKRKADAKKAEDEREARERIREAAREKALKEQNNQAKPKEDPFDFSRFTTVEALKAEREKRLNVAIMNPTIDNMAAYQAINAHVLALSARFAQAWQLGRLLNPMFDYTATHPSANFATAALTDVKREETAQRLRSLNGDAGLIFIAKPGDPLTDIASGPVRAFARTWNLPLMATAVDETVKAKTPGKDLKGFEAFDEVLPDGGRATLWGIKTFPAVVLVPTPQAMAKRPDFALLKGALAGRNGMLVAAGAVSGEELSRRITFLLKNSDTLSGLESGVPMPHLAPNGQGQSVETPKTLTTTSAILSVNADIRNPQ